MLSSVRATAWRGMARGIRALRCRNRLPSREQDGHRTGGMAGIQHHRRHGSRRGWTHTPRGSNRGGLSARAAG